MATRLFGNIKAGAASVTKPVYLRKTADGTADAGLVAAGLSAYYYRQGASATVGVTLSDLSGLNSAYASGGVKEVADGIYRVDWPDAAFLAGADFVVLVLKDGTISIYSEEVAIEAHGADDVFGGMSTYAGGVVAGVTAPVTVADGSITSAKFTVSAPSAGLPTGILEKIDRVFRRFFGKADRTPTQLKTYADDSVTVLTTQTVSDDGAGNESQGAAS